MNVRDAHAGSQLSAIWPCSPEKHNVSDDRRQTDGNEVDAANNNLERIQAAFFTREQKRKLLHATADFKQRTLRIVVDLQELHEPK